jgi:hypothetical protein
LDARKVKAGDPILAKLALAWKCPSCDLRHGAIIQGHVVTQKAHSKTEKTSEIGVVFDAGQCGGPDMKPLFLTVAAIVAPSPARDSDFPYAENLQPLSTAVGLNLNSNVRSISQASATVFVEPRPAKASIPVTLGQVVGIPHLAISVGQGADGASILSSTGHNVQLSAGTQLALVPNLRAEPNATGDAKSADPNAATGNATPEAAEPAPPNIADEREVCVTPDCTVAPPDGPVDQEIQGAQITFPLKGLGYLPPSADREMSGFNYDASIAYLGPSQFLFTFNPHVLVPRSGAEVSFSGKLRIVRAVLINLRYRKLAPFVAFQPLRSKPLLRPHGNDPVRQHGTKGQVGSYP